jgi:hypothetical protein
MDGKITDFETNGGSDSFKSTLSSGLGIDAS